jgi:hypothetical protein
MKIALIGDARQRYDFLFKLIHEGNCSCKYDKKSTVSSNNINSNNYKATIDSTPVELFSLDVTKAKALTPESLSEFDAVIYAINKDQVEEGYPVFEDAMKVAYYIDETPISILKELVDDYLKAARDKKAKQDVEQLTTAMSGFTLFNSEKNDNDVDYYSSPRIKR